MAKNSKGEIGVFDVYDRNTIRAYDRVNSGINLGYHIWCDDADLIRKYREASLLPEMQYALEEIKNTVFVYENGERPFNYIVRKDAEVTEANRKKLDKLFKDFYDKQNNIIDEASHFFTKYYIDGRLIIRKIRDKSTGFVQSYMIIDPTRAKKVKKNGVYVWYVSDIENDRTSLSGLNQVSATQGEEVPENDIIYVDSGIRLNGTTISHVHQALKPLHQLTQLRDHLLIYRIVRSPERLVFYIDTGGTPPKRAAAQIEELKQKYNYKAIFNGETGEIDAAQAKYSMIDNIWLSRNKDKTTEVSSIGGDVNLGSLEDYKIYFSELVRSLHLPQKVMDFDEGGRVIQASDQIDSISAEEQKFRKFCNMNRYRFSPIYIEFLFDHAIANKLLSENEVNELKKRIQLDFKESADFEMAFKFGNLRSKIAMLQEIQDFIGKPNQDNEDKLPVFSYRQAMREIMGYTDEQIEKIKQEIEEEEKEGFAFYVAPPSEF